MDEVNTVKPVLNGHSKRKQLLKIGFQYQLSLNAGQKYCRMLQESILQYFRPSLSYRLSVRSLFCVAAQGRFYCKLKMFCILSWSRISYLKQAFIMFPLQRGGGVLSLM